MAIDLQLLTMCMIQRGNEVLLIKRPSERGFPGYIAPGGKVEFPESLTEGAIREAREETGLTVKNIIYKGLDEYVNVKENVRYMVFNYIATDFDGECLENPPEGELLWVEIDRALELPMQDWFKRRFPLFFEPGTFEIHAEWDPERYEESELLKVTLT
jgi:8-oxo-dGTP diphosphatase